MCIFKWTIHSISFCISIENLAAVPALTAMTTASVATMMVIHWMLVVKPSPYINHEWKANSNLNKSIKILVNFVFFFCSILNSVKRDSKNTTRSLWNINFNVIREIVYPYKQQMSNYSIAILKFFWCQWCVHIIRFLFSVTTSFLRI